MNAASVGLASLGAAIGSAARHLIGRALVHASNGDFPWGTWLVNLTGTWVFGLFVIESAGTHSGVWGSLGAGFCGGFTTFSAMAGEAVNLLKSRTLLGCLYLVSSVGGGLFLVWVVLSLSAK
ncbi:MAG: CrcB family protein [Alicyclobacillaceae bacterium]|nr:CrcB family protein [Alicyclobacillaceae bacterium]